LSDPAWERTANPSLGVVADFSYVGTAASLHHIGLHLGKTVIGKTGICAQFLQLPSLASAQNLASAGWHHLDWRPKQTRRRSPGFQVRPRQSGDRRNIISGRHLEERKASSILLPSYAQSVLLVLCRPASNIRRGRMACH